MDEENYEFLHDLQNDPDELTNLAGNPQFQKKVKELRRLTDQKVAKLGGPLAPMSRELTLSTTPHPESAAMMAIRPCSDGFSDLLTPGNRMRIWA